MNWIATVHVVQQYSSSIINDSYFKSSLLNKFETFICLSFNPVSAVPRYSSRMHVSETLPAYASSPPSPAVS